MAAAISDAESETELFESAVRDVEEAAKMQPKKKPRMSKSQTERKRKKLLELSKDGIVGKPAGFIRKSNKDVIDRLYDEYENQRMSYSSDFYRHLLFQSSRQYWEVSM